MMHDAVPGRDTRACVLMAVAGRMRGDEHQRICQTSPRHVSTQKKGYMNLQPPCEERRR